VDPPRRRSMKAKCQNCGKEYERPAWRIGKYCSIKCQIAERKRSIPQRLFVCQTCKRIFTPKDTHLKRKPRFCSYRCKGSAFSGARHPNWKGGISKDKYILNKFYKMYRHEDYVGRIQRYLEMMSTIDPQDTLLKKITATQIDGI
jgi:hypothetical protein